MVTPAAADRVLRHAGVRGADARGAARLARTRSSRSCRSRIGRKAAASSCSRTPTKELAVARRRSGAPARRRSGTRRFCAAIAALAARSRRGRGVRPDPAGRAARDPPPRHDQRARVAPARYRGAAPVHRAVIAGEPETGVTIMRVVAELDAGPMLATARRADRPGRDERGGRARVWRSSARRCCSTVVEQLARGDGRRDAAGRLRRRPTRRRSRRPRARSTGRCRPPAFTTSCAACSPGRSPRRTLDGARCLIHRTAVSERPHG